VEINSAPSQLSNELVRHSQKTFQYRNSLPGFLIVCSEHDTLLRTDQTVRIILTRSALQIQSADFNCAMGRTDTLAVAPTGTALVAQAGQPVGNGTPFKPRPYLGTLQIYAAGDELCVINLAPIDDYLAGILAAELPHADLAALQAQAVVSRTYILRNQQRPDEQRHQEAGYQFCDLTHCQTYKGSAGVTPIIQQAVVSTQDEFLTFANQPIEAYYSSTCGGVTADDDGIWSDGVNQPYLKSISDSANHVGFCAQSPHFRWRFQMRADSLHQLWQQRLGEPINSITVTKKGEDNRIRELALVGRTLHLVRGEDFRTVVCRAFGWNTLKSTAFELRFEKNNYVFAGKGMGHGLGLCQYGTMEMARRGYSYQEILRHYFPGTEIKKYLKNGEG
jgi:stage II sporulation protein D